MSLSILINLQTYCIAGTRQTQLCSGLLFMALNTRERVKMGDYENYLRKDIKRLKASIKRDMLISYIAVGISALSVIVAVYFMVTK